MAANLTSGGHQAYQESGMNIMKGLQPDIVLIQEFNYEDGSIDSFVDDVFGEEFQYYRESRESLPNGIISRFPILSAGQWNDSAVSDRDFVWAVIDIPGEKNLQAVSVHLKAGTSSADADTRENQAKALESYVAANFNPDDYILVGGDLNVQNRSENALVAFNHFLSVSGHIPVDTTGNSNTNRDRTKPYDWLMPNNLLEARHTEVSIDDVWTMSEGLVFDSWTYSPLPPPVEKGDSKATDMQHMAVLKAYAIPTPQPTPTPDSLSPINSGDYDGDGSSDIAVFRPESGRWLVRGITTAYFGNRNDIPVSGDYDGDKTAELGVFRSPAGLWLIRGLTRTYFGTDGDRPVPADYDADGTCDIALFRPGNGIWAVRGTSRFYFGTDADLPAPGNWAGGTGAEAAVFRRGSALWIVRESTRFYFGNTGDRPLIGDFGGTGYTQAAIYRSAYGLWTVRAQTRYYFGGNPLDFPVPADFNGDGTAGAAVFRPGQGLWALRALSRIYYGRDGDLPVTK
ncbi:MAG TPA: hypothetical protein PK636_01440 [bacterium]|nr:hypothetical protein [bacterium]HPJ71329.1 hypothetical protein [bacterium]